MKTSEIEGSLCQGVWEKKPKKQKAADLTFPSASCHVFNSSPASCQSNTAGVTNLLAFISVMRINTAPLNPLNQGYVLFLKPVVLLLGGSGRLSKNIATPISQQDDISSNPSYYLRNCPQMCSSAASGANLSAVISKRGSQAGPELCKSASASRAPTA